MVRRNDDNYRAWIRGSARPSRLLGYYLFRCRAVDVDDYSSSRAELLAWHMQGDPGSTCSYFGFKLRVTISSTAVVDGPRLVRCNADRLGG